MQNLFAYQLIGDVIKIVAWVMANVLLARAQVKTYILYLKYFMRLFLFCYPYCCLIGMACAVLLWHFAGVMSFISLLFCVGF